MLYRVTDTGMLSDSLYPCEHGQVAMVKWSAGLLYPRLRMLCRQSRRPRAGVCLFVAASRFTFVWFHRVPYTGPSVYYRPGGAWPVLWNIAA